MEVETEVDQEFQGPKPSKTTLRKSTGNGSDVGEGLYGKEVDNFEGRLNVGRGTVKSVRDRDYGLGDR